MKILTLNTGQRVAVFLALLGLAGALVFGLLPFQPEEGTSCGGPIGEVVSGAGTDPSEVPAWVSEEEIARIFDERPPSARLERYRKANPRFNPCYEPARGRLNLVLGVAAVAFVAGLGGVAIFRS